MKRALNEPLLHFLLLGAAIFVAYGLVPGRDDQVPGRIVVSQRQVASMVLGFSSTWQRPPTREELEGLIRDRVQEEVYYREALALGLDKDDTIIRRRLRQKMQFVSEDVGGQVEPTDGDLDAYLDAHPEVFRVERRFTFQQVYLDPDKHGDRLARDAAQLLTQLNDAAGEVDFAALGDAFLLEHTFAGTSDSEVTKQFGEGFATRLGELPPGVWQGPIESAYGVHLVRLGERTEGRLPALAEVRDDVSREWKNARRLEANATFYAELLKRYTVVVEGPEAAERPEALAVSR